MGKRKNEQAPGGGGKSDAPKTKQSLREGSEATGDDSLDVTGAAQTGDADGKPKPAAGEAQDGGEMTRGSAGTNAPRSGNGNGEAAAPEQSQEGKRVPQEGRDTGIGGGGESPEAAAPGVASQPESPQRANSVLDETEEDQPAATTEQRGSAGEEPAAETQTHCGVGNVGDSPKHGSAAAARGEGAAGGGIALPADTPGRSTGSSVPTEAPDPRREEGVNGSERRADADQSQDPPHVSGNAEENESGAVSEGAAGGEPRENARRGRPRATGMTDAVKNAAESLRETSGEADVENDDEAGGEDPPSPGPSSAPDPAAPAGGNPASEGEGEAPGAEDAANMPRTDAQPPARSGHLPCDGGIAGSTPAVPATPGPAPMGAARLPAAGAGSAVGADPRDEAPPAGELRHLLEGKTLALPPQQPLPAADWRGSAVPGCELLAAAGRSRAEETPTPLAEGNGPDQPQPREDATDVICGLILELSNLNRLAMSAHRGLEALRRLKPRRSRWRGPGPVPPHAGRRWKET